MIDEKKHKVKLHPRKISNRHERLFCCGRNGPDFLIYFTQFAYVLSMVWFATFLAIRGYRLHLMVDTYFDHMFSLYVYMSFCWVPPTLTLLLQFVFIPYLLHQITVVTNIQMMRDRQMIYAVVQRKKFNSAMRSYRLYQVFKIIRRELVEAYG